MPAYVQHHQDIEIAPVICPTCMGFLPMYVREVEPHWSLAKIDFVYECADCGAEIIEDAEQCPKCGKYLSAEDSPGSGKSGAWWVIMVLLLLATLMLVVG